MITRNIPEMLLSCKKKSEKGMQEKTKMQAMTVIS